MWVIGQQERHTGWHDACSPASTPGWYY